MLGDIAETLPASEPLHTLQECLTARKDLTSQVPPGRVLINTVGDKPPVGGLRGLRNGMKQAPYPSVESGEGVALRRPSIRLASNSWAICRWERFNPMKYKHSIQTRQG
jgi:hypothetical protein